MSAALTLISANEVVNGGIVRPVPLNSRFDSQLLAPNIAIAEERFLIPCLCRAFYEDLIAQKTTDESNYNPNIGTGIVVKFGTNANYETLWKNYLEEVTARAVYFMSLGNIGIQSGSNGLFLNESQYAQTAGLGGIKFLKDEEVEKINLAINRMKRYLCENNTLFPLWPVDTFCKDCGCSCDDDCDCTSKQVKDQDPNFKGGIIFY